MDPILWIPGTALVFGAAALVYWLRSVARKVDDHAERISWLEAKTNGKHREG